jgi:CBS domain-containing protein
MAGKKKTVGDVMTRKVFTVAKAAYVADVVSEMSMRNIGAAVITDETGPVGIFTERDLLKRVAAKGLNPGKTTVSKAMTAKIDSVAPDDDLMEVARQMVKGNFRHITVTDGRNLAGILSMKDVLRSIAHVK